MKTPPLHLLTTLAAIVCSHHFANAQPTDAGTLYHAKTTIEVRAPAGQNALGLVRATLPKNDPSIRVAQLAPPQPPLIEVAVTDANPQRAAERANEITEALRMALNGLATDLETCRIWERATSAAAPKSK